MASARAEFLKDNGVVIEWTNRFLVARKDGSLVVILKGHPSVAWPVIEG